ncbi:MAG: zf-HC2 domain-containing protein [Clostridia bacterium]|nr:zf-HC2 domain-containing protein [Clostridia bacterium]
MEQKNQQQNGMTCEQVLALLPAYIDGALDSAQSSSVAAHLACCEQCRSKQALLSRLPEVMSEVLPTPDPALHDEIMEQVHKLPRRRTLPLYRIAAGVAAVFCFFAIGVFLSRGGFEVTSEDKVADAPSSSAPDSEDRYHEDESADTDGYFGEAEDTPMENVPEEEEPPVGSDDTPPDKEQAGDSSPPVMDDATDAAPSPDDTKPDGSASPSVDKDPTSSDYGQNPESSPPVGEKPGSPAGSDDEDCPGYPSADEPADYADSIPYRPLTFTPTAEGYWYCKDLALSLQFMPDGTVVYSETGLTLYGTYDLSRRTVTLDADGTPVLLSLRIGWNKLTLTRED